MMPAEIAPGIHTIEQVCIKVQEGAILVDFLDIDLHRHKDEHTGCQRHQEPFCALKKIAA